jgi:hypothetical protein
MLVVVVDVVLIVLAPYFFGLFLLATCVLPFAVVERAVARIRRHTPQRPRLAILAYAYQLAGVATLGHSGFSEAAELLAILSAAGLIVAAYGAVGMRWRLLLSIPVVLVTPLMWLSRYDFYPDGVHVAPFPSPLELFVMVVVPLTLTFLWLEHARAREPRHARAGPA